MCRSIGLKRIGRPARPALARNQIFLLYLNPPSVAWDLRCNEHARATRYRRLALAQQDKATADLLLSSQMNAIRGFSAPLNGVQPGHLAKMSSRQKQETRVAV